MGATSPAHLRHIYEAAAPGTVLCTSAHGAGTPAAMTTAARLHAQAAACCSCSRIMLVASCASSSCCMSSRRLGSAAAAAAAPAPGLHGPRVPRVGEPLRSVQAEVSCAAANIVVNTMHASRQHHGGKPVLTHADTPPSTPNNVSK